MTLFLDTGAAAGNKTRESVAESCLMVTPGSSAEIVHGCLLAVSEGLAERSEPMSASRDSLQALGSAFYATPDNWGMERILTESFGSANQALLTAGGPRRAASLSALVLRHRRWWIAHAGDTRVWLMRDHELRLLTRDHVTPRPGRRPSPDRACGLAPTLEPDLDSGELAEGDVFLLTTGGVHLSLDGALIMSCLLNDAPAQAMADCLHERAHAAAVRAPAGACVVRVEKLPEETAADMAENITSLPVIAPPEPGEVIDKFHIESLLHRSRQYRLYLAEDQESASKVVLKFPNPRLAGHPGFADSFLREEWIGKRIDSPYLVKTLPIRAGRRRSLYTMMAHQTGESLSARVKRKGKLGVEEAVRYTQQLLEALSQLHKQGVIHGDVRAKNIVVDRSKQNIYLLGLGSTHVDSLGAMTRNPETPKSSATHHAPELFDGAPASIRSDIYATGVTLYRMLTGRYPYGRISSRDSAPQGDMTPPSRHNDTVPYWLDQVLARACALDPNERFASASEFADALAELSGTDARPARIAAGASPAAPARQRRGEWLLLAALGAALAVYLLFALR